MDKSSKNKILPSGADSGALPDINKNKGMDT